MEISFNLICDVCLGKVTLLHSVEFNGKKLNACLECVEISVMLKEAAAQHYMQATDAPLVAQEQNEHSGVRA